MNKTVIFLSEYSTYDYHKKKLTEEQIKDYKEKFVLFEDSWDDFRFHTTFGLVYYDDKLKDDLIGYIKICHEDLEENGKETKKCFKEEEIIMDNKFFSIGNFEVYNNLVKLLKGDGPATDFLKQIREISTIEDNEEIQEILELDWYKKSFARYDEEKMIVAFTRYKNSVGERDNSYKILQNVLQHSDELRNDPIEIARGIIEFINTKRRDGSDEAARLENKIFDWFREKFIKYPDFINDVNRISNKWESDKIIDDIREALRVKEDELGEITLGHYTSLQTIKYLIKKDEGNKSDRAFLRLTNGRQLNDPLEGKILLEYILGSNEIENVSREWIPTFWYISSATTETDSLPMWKQYGADATGAMLIYEEKYLRTLMKNGKVEIYKVVYLDKDEGKISVISGKNPADTEGLQRQLDALKAKIKESQINISALNNIGFLFKKSDYSYENEYRIVVNTEDENNHYSPIAEEKPNCQFPFIYIYLEDIQIKYSKVILGPKSDEIDYVGPYINYCDSDIKIEKSKILFR